MRAAPCARRQSGVAGGLPEMFRVSDALPGKAGRRKKIRQGVLPDQGEETPGAYGDLLSYRGGDLKVVEGGASRSLVEWVFFT